MSKKTMITAGIAFLLFAIALFFAYQDGKMFDMEPEPEPVPEPVPEQEQEPEINKTYTDNGTAEK